MNRHGKFFWDSPNNNHYISLDELIEPVPKKELLEFEYQNFMLKKYFHLDQEDKVLLINRNIQAAKDYLLDLRFVLSFRDSIDKKEIREKYETQPEDDILRLQKVMNLPGVEDFYNALNILPMGDEYKRIHQYIMEGDYYYFLSLDFFDDLSKFTIINYDILLYEVFKIDGIQPEEIKENEFLSILRKHVRQKKMKDELKFDIYKIFKKAVDDGLFILEEDDEGNIYYDFQLGVGAARWFFFDGDFHNWTDCTNYVKSKGSSLPGTFRSSCSAKEPKEYLPIREKYFPEIDNSLE